MFSEPNTASTVEMIWSLPIVTPRAGHAAKLDTSQATLLEEGTREIRVDNQTIHEATSIQAATGKLGRSSRQPTISANVTSKPE